MIKDERHQYILNKLKNQKVISVHEIHEELKVTEMTIRRDLKELEKDGLLIRVHGGAKLLEADSSSFYEKSYAEKKSVMLNQKEQIAQLAASQIHSGDTIFLGSGTTVELLCNYITAESLKIVTNSFYVFDFYKDNDSHDVILLGGNYRSKTGAFLGSIANIVADKLHVEKAFFGINAVHDNIVYNSHEDEGLTQRIMINNARDKYILADYSKFNRKDFFEFYRLEDVDYFITDKDTSPEVIKYYSQFTTIIQ